MEIEYVTLSSVGTCISPECEGIILFELKKLFKKKKQTYVYNGYLGHKYIYNGKLTKECTNTILCNNNIFCSKNSSKIG